MKYSGMNVVVMGLGINGGGLESALYLARHGASLTVTDLRDEQTLRPSLERLPKDTRLMLGKHEMSDFESADMVVKNPAVRPDSPYLQSAIANNAAIETDISIFLSESPARLCAVTGSKGKSSTASALYFTLKRARVRGSAYLGGNIAVSPVELP